MAAKLTLANINACLTALTTALSTTSVIKFFVNNPAIGPGSVVADFTDAASVGIAAGSAVASWSSPYRNTLTGLQEVCGSDHTYTASSGVPPGGENLNGWYLTDMAGTTLEAAGYFPTPIPISAVGDGFTYAPCIDQSGFC